MVVHALQTAACGRRLTLTLGAAPARRRDPLHRRVLAHLGLPLRLAEPPANADAAYVFGGAMRWRRSAGDGADRTAGSPRRPSRGRAHGDLTIRLVSFHRYRVMDRRQDAAR